MAYLLLDQISGVRYSHDTVIYVVGIWNWWSNSSGESAVSTITEMIIYSG